MKPEKRNKNRLADLFYPVYKRFVEGRDFTHSVRKNLIKSNNPQKIELYLSKGLAYGLTAGIVLWLITLITVYSLIATGLVPTDISTGVSTGITVPPVLYTIWNIIEVPLILLVSGTIIGSITFSSVFGYFVFKPSLDAGARKREIDTLLPDSISYMYALSIGGLNQIEILEAIAQADDTYGEVSEEFKIILQETYYFDTDYRTAIKEHASKTPSTRFSRFLSDMLSVLNTGGDIESFLRDKKRKYIREAKQEQEKTLETLELFGEMYMTLSLFPLLLIIVLVIMGIMGSQQTLKLTGTVYGLIPMTGIAFLVLISTVKQDETGSGILTPESNAEDAVVDQSLSINYGELVEERVDEHSVFEKIQKIERSERIHEILTQPHIYFRDNPLHTLVITLPLSIAFVIGAIVTGIAPLSIDALKANVIFGTVLYFYVPSYIIATPIAIFHEWKTQYRGSITKNFSETLRKLANANDIGLTLFEAFKQVAETSEGRLSKEFQIIHKKVKYGMSIEKALIEFNNKYKIPRISRTVKLITKSQKASNQITQVLVTAAEASETQDDLIRQRKSQARMQVAIILMTYLTLLAVMAILQTRFIGVMAELVNASGGGGGGGGGGGSGGMSFSANLDVEYLSLLFFHAVTLQGAISGLISGYMRDAKIMSGAKYLVILQTIAILVWLFVV